MKRVIIMGFLSLVSSIVFAQEQKGVIPPDVTDAFSLLYPKVKDVSWNIIEKDFEASFVQSERTISLLFDQNGNLMMVKNKIDQTQLPAPVIGRLKTDYPDWNVEDALLIDVTGTSSYQVLLEKAGERVSLTCSGLGDHIKILSQKSLY